MMDIIWVILGLQLSLIILFLISKGVHLKDDNMI
jgi:hypothetical protein